MRLDTKTRERIIEALAICALADEEELIGPSKSDTRSLRDRAIARYVGTEWNADAPIEPLTVNRFRARIKRTAYMIFEAIEKDELMEHRRQLQAIIDRR